MYRPIALSHAVWFVARLTRHEVRHYAQRTKGCSLVTIAARVRRDDPATWDWLKARWAVLVLLLFATPVTAQSNLLGTVTAERSRYPTPMTSAQLGELVNRVAWTHRSEGWGLLRKPTGTTCPAANTLVACDILVHAPSGLHFDVLADADGAATPRFDLVGPIDLSRFVAAVDPGGVPPGPPPPVTPTPPAVDEVVALLRQSRLEDSAQQERIFADLVARTNLDYADRQDFKVSLARIEMKLREMDERPSWLGHIWEWVKKPETITAIVASVASALTTLKVKD